MHYFRYKGKELYAEDVPLRELAKEYGTPLYVYSEKTLLRHLNAYKGAFDGFPHIVCFALKANSNIRILGLLAENGAGADIVSGGELYRALKAGINPKRIVYAGVGKTEEEIGYALKSGILMFNVESVEELTEINRVAGLMRLRAPVALRVNPDIDPETHPYISTGLKKHKFGIPIEDALEYYRAAGKMKNIKVIGIHKHIGSQLTKVSPFVDALKKVLALMDELKAQGLTLSYLDMGGGLGITYNNETPPQPEELARSLIPLLKGRENITLIIEPGRSIVGNAGILLTKCLYRKKGAEREFVIVDAGMNDLMRPALYGAYHEVLPVVKRMGKKTLTDIVGPICESGDFLAKDRMMTIPRMGDCLAVMSAGAYGFSMGSNYNSRTKAAEVIVSGKTHLLIRKRETYRDLIRGEA
jgi:diaminopimelate decarboxylase